MEGDGAAGRTGTCSAPDGHRPARRSGARAGAHRRQGRRAGQGRSGRSEHAAGRRAHHRVLRRRRRRRARSPTTPRCARPSSGPAATASRWSPAAPRSSRTRPSSSMAGQFDSVIGIDGLRRVRAARCRSCSTRGRAPARAPQPIAVLVQPLIEPAFGGVLFGVDPVTGRTDRRVVSAVERRARAARERRGRRVALRARRARPSRRASTRGDGPSCDRATCAGSARSPTQVAARVRRPAGRRVGDRHRRRAAGSSQSRPVTTEVARRPRGPVYGPGPVAETFPEPLTELEHDLWVPPLRDAVARGGAARRHRVTSERSRRARSSSPCTATSPSTCGSPARSSERPSLLAAAQPRARRPAACAAHGGSAGSAPRCPASPSTSSTEADADLEAVPPLAELTSRQLLALLHRSQRRAPCPARPRDPHGHARPTPAATG